ncbi:DUF411 domain-containing protein [[Limnothrix rosea] IAM M-220]|uniref:DUF411 domain-containing protein n=1 Tax=[Limnothrix rosea] IAM M-220 TaxID=454133 RepID=UPI00095C0A54|nr:DUF411 domain-containing protein [[Limnothrix rosea] IAM M-220]OKH18573.1 hypothetical protein NIES208_05020 [[Limnothrix rosea] IAM M-220]
MKRLIFIGVAAVSLGFGGWYWWGLTRSGSMTADVNTVKTTATQLVAAEVFRTPTCGCCGLWIDHAEAHNFTVVDHQQEDLTPIKEQYGITPELASCHTTIVDGYVFEGHIPATEVQRFLANPPKDVIGLTVPGMPIGSPGMEMANKSQPYAVLALHRNGSTSVFAEY